MLAIGEATLHVQQRVLIERVESRQVGGPYRGWPVARGGEPMRASPELVGPFAAFRAALRSQARLTHDCQAHRADQVHHDTSQQPSGDDHGYQTEPAVAAARGIGNGLHELGKLDE